MVKNPPANKGDARDTDLMPGLGKSPGSPVQYSCLENSVDQSLAGYSPWDLRVGHMTDGLTDNGFHNSHHSESIPGPCHAFISPVWHDFPTPYFRLNSFRFLLPPLPLLHTPSRLPVTS